MYFIISDIHGHFDEMIFALKKSGYDNNNSNHHLIVIGDMFDRGTQSKEVLEYLYNLNIQDKASIILGNHDCFIIEFLNGDYKRTEFNIKYNGTGDTISSLLGINYKVGMDLEEIKNKITKKYSYLSKWLKSLPLYLEIGDYIFVHGGINGEDENWREGKVEDFVWSRQNELPPVEGKTMVVGHTRVVTIRYPRQDYKELLLNTPEAFNILFDKSKIFIDSFVEISKMINVLRLDI